MKANLSDENTDCLRALKNHLQWEGLIMCLRPFYYLIFIIGYFWYSLTYHMFLYIETENDTKQLTG